jgi:preprotein translocase subunit YajC
MFTLAQAASGGGGSAGPWQMLIQFWPVIAIVAIMYFLLIAPQRKKEKKRQEMLRSLEKNDRVVTIGGIHGVVKSATDKEVTLLVDEKRDLTLKLNRSAIYAILDRGQEEGEGELPLKDEQK